MAQDLTAPVIDLEAPDAVAQIDHACSNVGFFQCRGHGMPQDVIDDSLEASYEFFRLSSDEKEKAGSGDPEIERGFTAAETEGFAYSMGVETPPDLVQSFSLGRPTYPDDAVFHTTEHHFFDPNIWPERPAGMREALEKWYGAVNRLSDHVLGQVALALDLEEGFFVDKVDHSVDTLRFNYFYVEPDTPEPIAKQFGIGPHTDYGIMTTMYATPGPGLQILGPSGGWVDVYPADGAFLFNLGDLLAQWTNDRYRSTLHRVNPLLPQAERVERISVPFFREGNFDNWIECLPSCWSEDNPPKYAPVNAGEHLMAKFMGGRTMEASEEGVSTLGDRADAVLDD